MPRFPHTAEEMREVRASVFSRLAHRLASCSGEIYPFHVGDTYLDPAEGCRMEDLATADWPGLHRYAAPRGMPALLEALAARATVRHKVPTAVEDVLVSAGATGGIGAILGAILSPGDEVLILAPFWPLIDGIVRTFRGTPVAVPFLGVAESPESAVEIVERARTARTVALYVSTPNNPTGRVIPPTWLGALARWAELRGLWILSDEVYEDYVYRGEHAYLRSLAPERTFSAHSFSKAWGMAGNRCGYVVGPAAVMEALGKVVVHTFYSTPTASQAAALRALDGRGDAWAASARECYRPVGAAAARRLGIAEPEGSQFLWLDVAPALGEGGLERFLERCADRGLAAAPGPSFGPYPTHVRLCYTAAPPEATARGFERLAAILGR